MTELMSTVLALVAVALVGAALWAMSAGNFAMAGMSFLSASIVIYIRETRGQGVQAESQ